MPSDRLNELLKQRAMIESHLEWLEAEIARESRMEDLESEAAPVPVAPAPNRLEKIEAKEITTSEEPKQEEVVADLYEELGPDTSSALEARRGCAILFVIAFVVLGGLVGLAYYLY